MFIVHTDLSKMVFHRLLFVPFVTDFFSLKLTIGYADDFIFFYVISQYAVLPIESYETLEQMQSNVLLTFITIIILSALMTLSTPLLCPTKYLTKNFTCQFKLN